MKNIIDAEGAVKRAIGYLTEELVHTVSSSYTVKRVLLIIIINQLKSVETFLSEFQS